MKVYIVENKRTGRLYFYSSIDKAVQDIKNLAGESPLLSSNSFKIYEQPMILK